MTTFALVFAMTPIALKLGEGSEFRAPMAITVIGGLLTSTLLTLVLIPAVYTIFDDLSAVITRSLRGRPSLTATGRARRVRTEVQPAPAPSSGLAAD